jgi:hypothetical protein
MMRMLPRVETTGCMRELFLYASGKTLTGYKNLDFIRTPFLKATDSFPAIAIPTGFDHKISSQCIYFGFRILSCHMNSSALIVLLSLSFFT